MPLQVPSSCWKVSCSIAKCDVSSRASSTVVATYNQQVGYRWVSGYPSVMQRRWGLAQDVLFGVGKSLARVRSWPHDSLCPASRQRPVNSQRRPSLLPKFSATVASAIRRSSRSRLTASIASPPRSAAIWHPVESQGYAAVRLRSPLPGVKGPMALSHDATSRLRSALRSSFRECSQHPM